MTPPPTGLPPLVVDGACVRAGPFVLRVDLHVDAGETVAVVGPNGAGKTTLLRAVAGLAPLSEGRIAVAGAVVEDAASGVRVAPERRPVGTVFADPLLFPHLSVLDNVAYGLRRNGTGRRAARAGAAEWLERVDAGHLAERRPRSLSGGEAQRVALARVLARCPHVLLLDEPLSALDATARPAARRLLRDQLGRFGGGRILVTHDVAEAAELAGRVVVLEAGRVVQEGPADTLGQRPLSPFVADLARRLPATG